MDIGAGLMTKMMDGPLGRRGEPDDNCFPDLKFEDRLRGFCIFSILGRLDLSRLHTLARRPVEVPGVDRDHAAREVHIHILARQPVEHVGDHLPVRSEDALAQHDESDASDGDDRVLHGDVGQHRDGTDDDEQLRPANDAGGGRRADVCLLVVFAVVHSVRPQDPDDLLQVHVPRPRRPVFNYY